MSKREMLINYAGGQECRIAIVEDGQLEELYQDRASADLHVGNIYKGRVAHVEPAIQAAFIDFGLERSGFLHITDLHPMYFGQQNKEEKERIGQKTPHRERPPIQNCLRRGQEILVQVLKEGLGTKGPTVTSYLSIPGRFLVLLPYMERLGVSRKVEDDDARRQMRKILDELDPPKEFGFIIRTAGIGRTKSDLKRDLAYLQRLWKMIDQRMKNQRSGIGELYTESDLVIRTIRDVYTSDIDRIIVDDVSAARRAQNFLAIASPRSGSPVFVYNDPVPLFDRFGIEQQIETINARVVPLPSGGSLVFDSAEALVAIDVNSGKSRESRDAETTAFKTNLEATDEVCRQLRLRDLGGVVVIDLIDMRALKHRRQIEQRFRDNLKRDRARTHTTSISQFGILEMTRQRMRPSLKTSIYMNCPSCNGAGHVKSPESVVLDVMRRLALTMHQTRVNRVELTISPDVAFQLLNRKRGQLTTLEQKLGKRVTVRVGGGSVDYIELAAFDAQDHKVMVEPPHPLDDNSLTPINACGEPIEIVENTEAENTDQSQPQEDTETASETTEAKPRRRRRRRGGRGRGRKSETTETAPLADADASEEQAPAAPATDGQDSGEPAQEQTTPSVTVEVNGNVQTPATDKPRRRRRRGGRGRSRGAKKSTPDQAVASSEPNGS